MSRTPIPDHLVHRPEEVARNAGRFDQLCQLAEEIALPFVENALARETAATAAEALTSEAKLALEGLLNDAALRDLEEPGLLDEVRKSMEGAVPPPDEKERRALARDVAQVLMGTWVEILRGELSRAPPISCFPPMCRRKPHNSSTMQLDRSESMSVKPAT